jgi:hypothetical protein
MDTNWPVTFERLNLLEEKLMDCKNLTHEEFRNSDEKNVEDPHNLLDIRIGTSYHEFLHVKEFVYILEKYSKRIESTRDEILIASVTDARENLPRKMAELYKIFKECDDIINIRILPEYKDTNLPRIMYIHGEIVDGFLWTSLDKMYKHMFGNVADGYLNAAQIFMEHGFYDWAEKALKDGYGKNPEPGIKERMDKLKKENDGLKSRFTPIQRSA